NLASLTTLNRPMLLEWEDSFLRLHEVTYKRRNFIYFGIRSEVSCLENVNLSVQYIPAMSCHRWPISHERLRRSGSNAAFLVQLLPRVLLEASRCFPHCRCWLW